MNWTASYFDKSAKAEAGKLFRIMNFDSRRIMGNLPTHFSDMDYIASFSSGMKPVFSSKSLKPS